VWRLAGPSTKGLDVGGDLTLWGLAAHFLVFFRISTQCAAWLCHQNCSFSIDEETDPNRQFSVNSYGLITTAKPLDRETQREHRIHVLATDKGKD